MEIEQKYLIHYLPDGLDRYEHEEIEQAYLCQKPAIRVRRKGGRYIFTYKNREQGTGDGSVCVAEEIETEIDFDAYMHLFEKADGEPIRKTRYKIPYEKFTIELDIFHGKREGLILAEVEFESVEESKSFVKPDWFGENVSGDIRYSNSYMATHDPD
ncbi:MAG: CYTH domain-containing protein [Eubacterium sp.]|nr:CYTH domain-containing protein [Eubacterium sp.]